MALIFRWLIRLAALLIVLSVLTIFLVYWLASRSLPDYADDVSVRGLSAPVEILRDNANVPHIFGQRDEDVYFGLGFAHAQDRMWQMITLRRTAQGRLSEVFGARTLNTDKLLRRLDIYPSPSNPSRRWIPDPAACWRLTPPGSTPAWIRSTPRR